MDSRDNDEINTSPALLLCSIPPNDSHFDTVKKLTWRPTVNNHHIMDDELNEGMMHLTLASCGQDNGVRIFNLAIKMP